MAEKATSSTESVESNETANISDEVLEFIDEFGFSGVDDKQFSGTYPIYQYLTETHNMVGDEVLEFLIEKLNAALDK